MNLFLNVDSKAYNTKPDPAEVRAIQGRLCTPQTILFDDFVKAVCTGHSFRQCAADGKSEKDFISTQLLAVDIDNKSDGDYLSIDDALKRAEENRITINFLYPSFSDVPEHRRFRMVFILDKPVQSADGFKKIYDYLISVFPGCDTSCRNPAHIFFGTNASPIVVNTERVNSKKSLTHRKPKGQKAEQKSKTAAGRRNKKPDQHRNKSKCATAAGGNIEAIRKRDETFLKQKLNRIRTELNNRDEFFHWLYCELDLSELLEVPKNFNCIFHDDTNASASVFQTNYGTWKYKCFSESCEVDTLNTKEVVELLGGFTSEYEALKFIKTIYNVTIRESEWSREQKENIDSIMDCFNSRTETGFNNCCPAAFKTTRYAGNVFNALLRIARQAIYPERTSDTGNIIFYASVKQIMKESGNNSADKVTKYIKLLAYHGMIEILDDSQVPTAFLMKARKHQKNQRNHVQFYSIPSWVIQQKLYIDGQGIRWKENGYRVAGISYECFYRTEGAEVAGRLYPQTAHFTDKQGEIQQKEPSRKSDDRTRAITECIMNQIESRGYATEKDILQELRSVMGWNLTDTQIKRSMQEILDTYGLKKIRANAELKEKYQMELPPRSNPAIIIQK